MAHCVVGMLIPRKHSVQQNRVGHTAPRGAGRPVTIIVILTLGPALGQCGWKMSLIDTPVIICRSPIQILQRREIIYGLGSETLPKTGSQTHTPVQQVTAVPQEVKRSAAAKPWGIDELYSDRVKKRSLWSLMLWGQLARSGGVVKGHLVGDCGTWQ